MNQGRVPRRGPGRPRLRPRRLVADKGYSIRRIRQWCHQHGVRVTIPHRRDQRRAGPFDCVAYRERARVEQTINRLKQWRRIATRYDKRAASYLAMVTIAAIRWFL